MTDQQVPPTNALYALERDGNEYRAAFYQQNGAPGSYAPEWRDVSEDEFYTLAGDHADAYDYGTTGPGYVYQSYDLDAQLDRDLAEMAEQNGRAAGAGMGVL